MTTTPQQVLTYFHPDTGIERKCRRSRQRDGDDPRIDHLFEAFENHIESAKLNGDEYTAGYFGAMRTEFSELLNDILAKLQAAPQAQAAPVEMSPDFTDTARAALLWVLWHHQGGSSPVGQPIRYALGMGAHEHLNAYQVGEAKRWAAITGSQTSEFHCAKQAAQGVGEVVSDAEIAAMWNLYADVNTVMHLDPSLFSHLVHVLSKLIRAAHPAPSPEAVPDDLLDLLKQCADYMSGPTAWSAEQESHLNERLHAALTTQQAQTGDA